MVVALTHFPAKEFDDGGGRHRFARLPGELNREVPAVQN
jgi:hypothetical protein